METTLEALAEQVSKATGFDSKGLAWRRLDLLRSAMLRERLDPQLASDRGRFEELACEAIRVGETYFYRQAEHFDFLMEHILSLRSDEPFLAWSAGCSTGEEAYSLAACLRACLPYPEALEVLGTDMSEASLTIAREGVFGKWSLRREGDHLPKFLQGGPDRFEVSAEVKALTRFERANLLEAPPLGGRKARIIFCRNVLIYFKPEAARRVMAHLSEALEDEGLLVMGSVDLDFLPEGLSPVEPRVLQIYKKSPRLAAPRHLAALPSVAPVCDEPAFDAKAAHVEALALEEAGATEASLKRLQELRIKAPGYLPGVFDLAMALSRRGSKREAAGVLEGILEVSRGRNDDEMLNAPEIVSLGFYRTSAETFLQRYGTRQ